MDCSSVHFSRHAYPSTLLLGFTQRVPLHVLVARDDEMGNCYVVTVYHPDPELWGSDFKTRREA